jgi:primosomal protein N' (replication factor Y)
LSVSNNDTTLFNSSSSFEREEWIYAEVIIPLALPTTYTWAIPKRFVNAAKIGVRVEVQLRNKKYAGIISKILKEKPQAFQPKEIINVLDDEPLVHEKHIICAAMVK